MTNLCQKHGLYPCISCLSYEEWQEIASKVEGERKRIADEKLAQERAVREAYEKTPEGKREVEIGIAWDVALAYEKSNEGREHALKQLECEFCGFRCKKFVDVQYHRCGPKARALARIEAQKEKQ